MLKKYYTWDDIEMMSIDLVNQMYNANWRPDIIVGLTRGGNIPATIISNMLDVQCESLKIRLRDNKPGEENETNCDLARLAFGYIPEEQRTSSRWDVALRWKILVVDDINDSGATLNYLRHQWQQCCYPDSSSWETVWNHNVKFAVLTENLSSNFHDVSFYCDEVNKAEEDVWLVYPWETVGKYGR
jgi:hypoxanthine phosphoribosyltransferase